MNAFKASPVLVLLPAILLSLPAWAQPAASRRVATPPEAIHTMPDFNVELLTSAEPEEGSWVAMAKDNKGRLILSPQYPRPNDNAGLLRVTIGADGQVAKKEFIAKPLYDAQGLAWVNGALYVVVNKYNTKLASGLYRVRDTSGDDQFGDVELLKAIPGGGEHGPHAVAQGPDGMLYVICGNHTKVVQGAAPDSPHQHFAEDHVLPRQFDAQGHAAGILAPGGHILRTDLDGKNWEMVLAGFRNTYDFAFNADGEILCFDSDMEWEWGTHWYRPTRVYHCIPGGDYGWRSGSAKWPVHYTDGLPPAVDVGLGSPTGVKFGYGAKFPAKYQRALYILDWTYGRIFAVHLTPNGATYTGFMELFVAPKGLLGQGEKRPLNVTDAEIGDDGALYFTAGGRGTQAGLYRVTYTGKASTAPAKLTNSSGSGARELLHKLGAFAGKADPKAVAFAWPHLNSDDRWIRYAARIAIESQPLESWKDRALAEKKPTAALGALMALARVGGKESQEQCLITLATFSMGKLSEAQQLEKLRILEISFARHGRPSARTAQLTLDTISYAFPAKSDAMNRELVQLLVFLRAPGVVEKAFALMDAAPTQEERMAYIFHLRTLPVGWTPEQREHYFTALNGYPKSDAPHEERMVRWFNEAGRPYADGNSFRKQLDLIRRDAVETLTETEKTQLASLIAPVAAGAGNNRNAFPAAQQRKLVKEWKTADLLAALEEPVKGRSFEKGRQAFADAQCVACHKIGNDGGGVGPDLTAVSARFTRRDVLESIIEPSKVLSEQFLNTNFTLKSGDGVTGRVVDETPDKVVIYTNPFTSDRTEIKKANITAREGSKVSPMPEGLANVLSKEDILDLLAFLEAGGRRDHPAFR